MFGVKKVEVVNPFVCRRYSETNEYVFHSNTYFIRDYTPVLEGIHIQEYTKQINTKNVTLYL